MVELTLDMQGWHEEPILGVDSLTYLSNSKIKKYIDNPYAFHRHYIKKIKTPDTDSKRLGRIIHTAVLEPAKFMAKYAVMPDFSGKGSVAMKADWKEEHRDRLILTDTQADKILYMIDSVRAHPEAAKFLKKSTKEVVGYYYDKVNDQWWMIILDFLQAASDSFLVGDLKSAASARPDDFGRDIGKYGYFIQAAIYSDITEKLLGKPPTEFPFVVVENVEPYTTEVHYLPGHLLELGRQMYQKAAQKIKIDLAKHQKDPKHRWQGYTKKGSISRPDIPNWLYNQITNNEEYFYGQ